MGTGRERLAALEGLRGLMAWWVVAIHLAFLSGVTGKGAVYRALTGEVPVLVFVVLSGFVIFALLERRDLTVGQFIGRRWFRLWPVYAVCLVSSLVLFPLERANMAQHPAAEFYAARHTSWSEHITEHVAASLAFLHGMTPRSVLPDADRAFLMPGWSIGLEWQFYLVAPFVFALVYARRSGQIAGAVAVLLISTFGERMSWNGAALPAYARYFAVGIASFYAWRESKGKADWRFAAVAYLVAFPFLDFALRIWGLVMLAICTEGLAPVRRLLASRPVVALGRVSYSTYLAHWPMLTLYTAARLRWLDLTPWQATALGLVTFPAIYGVSVGLYRFVELPGIALGRRLTTKRVPVAA